MKYPRYQTFHWLSVLFFFCIGTANAQNTLQVFTKTINRTLKYQPGDTLAVIAEKANVELTVWDHNHIAVEVKLISKHAKKEIAEKELNYLKLIIDKQENTHSLKNYFMAEDNFRKVKGRLLIHYALQIPRDCPVILKNLYGKVTVEGLNSSFNSNTRFVELHLKKCEGDINIESLFGKAVIDECSGTLTGDLKKADMELSGFKGDVKIESSYGRIRIESDKLASLTVKGSRTRISLLTSNLQSYNYDLNTSFAEISLPDMILPGHLPEKKSFKKIFNQKNPLITIHTTYSPIEIKLQYNASSK